MELQILFSYFRVTTHVAEVAPPVNSPFDIDQRRGFLKHHCFSRKAYVRPGCWEMQLEVYEGSTLRHSLLTRASPPHLHYHDRRFFQS
jgi:hypothetical protein